MIAEPSDPKIHRVIGLWHSSLYVGETEARSGGLSVTTDDAPSVPAGLSRRPVDASPHSEPTSPIAAASPSAHAPERGGSPGLYDLPGLLTRIWSVPAAKLATSGSYATRPTLPISPARELDEPHPHTPLETQWPQPAMEPGLSLPLAAVPSLAIVRAVAPEAATHPLPRGPEPPTLVFSAETHYAAWRHPPCRLRYSVSRTFASYRGAGPAALDTSGEHRHAAASDAPRSQMMPPATLPWVRVRRIDEEPELH